MSMAKSFLEQDFFQRSSFYVQDISYNNSYSLVQQIVHPLDFWSIFQMIEIAEYRNHHVQSWDNHPKLIRLAELGELKHRGLPHFLFQRATLNHYYAESCQNYSLSKQSQDE